MSDPIDELQGDDGSIDARRLHGHGSASSHAPVSREACRRLRVALLYGAELREHTHAVGYERDAAHYHASGKCSHDHGVPPVEHTTSGHGTGGRWVIDTPATIANRLADATGRPAEAFKSDAPLPALDDLESVPEGER